MSYLIQKMISKKLLIKNKSTNRIILLKRIEKRKSGDSLKKNIPLIRKIKVRFNHPQKVLERIPSLSQSKS
jgi:hypothetical protein